MIARAKTLLAAISQRRGEFRVESEKLFNVKSE